MGCWGVWAGQAVGRQPHKGHIVTFLQGHPGSMVAACHLAVLWHSPGSRFLDSLEPGKHSDPGRHCFWLRGKARAVEAVYGEVAGLLKGSSFWEEARHSDRGWEHGEDS